VRPAGGRVEQAQAQEPVHGLVGGVDVLQDPRQLAVRRLQSIAIARPERRECHPATGAMHERATELVLERPEALTDARGGEAEALGAAAEVQLVGQREKDADLAELDRFPHRVATLQGPLRMRPLITGIGSRSMGRRPATREKGSQRCWQTTRST
jgi:hypothetical protein